MILEKYYNKENLHDYMSKEGYDVILLDYLQSLGLEGDTVLEIGAGFGRYTNCLSQEAKKVIAVEPNQFMYEQHQENFKQDQGVQTIQSDLKQLLDISFDEKISHIFLFHVLHHLPKAEFENLYKLTEKLGAKLIVVEPNHLNPLFAMQLLFTKDMTWKEEKGMFRNNSKKLVDEFFADKSYNRFYIGFLPRGLNNKLAQNIKRLSNYRIFKTKTLNPFSAYSILEVLK